MSDRAKTIGSLPVINSIANNCLLIIEDVNTVSGNSSSTTSQVELGSLLNSNQNMSVANLVINNTETPANSTANVVKNTIWFDNDFLYIAVANNVIKRAVISSF